MKSIVVLFCVALPPLLTLISSQTARANHLCGNGAACCHACPQCNYVCKLDVTKSEQEKECFDVEAKVVCIPRVVFPWQKNCGNPCANNGGRIREICVLKTESYKCPQCKYTWTAEKRTPCVDAAEVPSPQKPSVEASAIDAPAMSVGHALPRPVVLDSPSQPMNGLGEFGMEGIGK
ncbi:MAG: hypothetical protein ACO1RT_10345 [Planctomycetaceae bacterium]